MKGPSSPSEGEVVREAGWVEAILPSTTVLFRVFELFKRDDCVRPSAFMGAAWWVGAGRGSDEAAGGPVNGSSSPTGGFVRAILES